MPQGPSNPGWPPSNPPGFFGPFNPVGPSANPGGTNPFPLPSNLPVPSHDFPRNLLTWVAGSPSGNPVSGVVEPTLWTATWSTAILDLRPELRASNVAAPMNVCPVWRQTYGVGGQLFVQVENLLGTIQSNASTPNWLSNLVVNSIESAHPNDPGLVATAIQPEDISSNFTPNQQAAILTFVPPGLGCPVRYWQSTLVFDILDVPGSPTPPPIFFISAAYY